MGQDFVAAARPFVASMFVDATDTGLRDWVIADLWPTNIEANCEHVPTFEAFILPGTDHFVHMDVLKQMKADGEIAHVGITTSHGRRSAPKIG
ncbi:hypothetical protein [Ectothiorhodospira lacustris]|uniref:hypothetical protein n=1 Tax=Ectothiorhodospira lacustris TaxID=2899127 RepID=UPI001EE7D91C|nr:hypothetical protein [Ectothiorhodospira lacustris]MCG5502048.1 hypothetical protein [Ectothiorhodospira lacustris]MCG5511474.1 hypothetical protein [Ectothiorhodospira lacustris]MCG5523263.1 hypothetical protein [Ectothiorhodospira lacustris]